MGRPLGKNQLSVLSALGAPSLAMVVPSKEALSLVRRGFLRTAASGGFACITPAGLRYLADALESGKVEGCLEGIKRTAVARPTPAPGGHDAEG